MSAKLKAHGSRWLSVILSGALLCGSLSAGWGNAAAAGVMGEEVAVTLGNTEVELDVASEIAAELPAGMEPSLRYKLENDESSNEGGLKAEVAPATDPDEQVNLIVELAGEPLLSRFSPLAIQMQAQAVQNRQAVLENEHTAAKQRLSGLLGGSQGSTGLMSRSAAQGPEVVYEYFTVLNGLSIVTEYKHVEQIAALEGVKQVWVASQYEPIRPADSASPMLASSSDMLGASQAYELGLTGRGTTVAIIDTGLDWKHEAFASNMPPQATLKHNRSKVAAILTANEMSAGNVQLDAVYINDKVPFAYDYADKDTNVIPSRSNHDNVHGTHVAGIVAGNGGEIKGIAPDAQLLIMKVFNDVNSFTNDASILAALDDSVKLGADVINMSLGANAGFTEAGESSKQAMYERIGDAGIQLIVSAGNNYSSAYGNQSGRHLPYAVEPDNAIIASPSTYPAALSVASMKSSELTKMPYLQANGRDIMFEDFSGPSDPKLQALEGTYEYVYAGFGSEEELQEAGDLKGKIALISRAGDISFSDKVMNAYAAGAVAAVIFNNEAKSVVMDISYYFIPAVLISEENGNFLRQLDTKQMTVGEELTANMANPEAGRMSDFSSWGPAPDLKMKPEITAPGDPVYSSVLDNGYENLSGTSMAAPNAAGAAALIKQYVQNKTGAASSAEISGLVQSLMMSTAVPVQDEEGQYYSPRKQGAGMVSIRQAMQAEAYLSVEGSSRPKAELGYNTDGRFSFTFTIHSLSDQTKSYTLKTAALSEKFIDNNGKPLFAQQSQDYTGHGVDVQYAGADNGTVTVEPHGQATVSVTITLSDELKQQLDRTAVNGTFIDGFVLLTEEQHQLSLPFLGFYGDWAQPALFDGTQYGEEGFSIKGSYPYNKHAEAPYLLGQNHIALELGGEGVIEPEKFAISPKGLSKVARAIGTSTGLLRNAEQLTYAVKDHEGHIVKEMKYSYIPKSYYSYGSITYAEAFMPSQPFFDGLDQNKQEVPEGRYTYEVSGTASGIGGSVSDMWSFDFTYDKTPPSLSDYRVYEENQRTYLELTVQDNHYVSGLQVATSGGGAVSDLVAVKSPDSVAADGSTLVTVHVDITEGLKKLEEHNMPTDKVYVDLFDYAMNYSRGEVTLRQIEAEQVTLDQTELALTVGTTRDLKAVVTPDNATNPVLVWSSSNPAIAEVDDHGAVSGVAEGEAMITVATSNGKKATSTITVNPIGDLGIVLEREELEMKTGESHQLKATLNEAIVSGSVGWKSSNEKVAAVDQNGGVTAIAEGTAEITATISGKSATIRITVVYPVDPDFVVENGVLVEYNGMGGHLTIPENVREIAGQVFQYRNDIYSLKFGPNLRKIGAEAFAYNTELSSIEFSNGLETIGENAFYEASKLTELLLPDSVTEIGANAFAKAMTLQKVHLPSGLVRIEDGVFQENRALTTINIPASLTEIGNRAFYITPALTSIELPDALQKIEAGAFTSSGLSSVIIPRNVREIGERAFMGSPVQRLELGAGVTTIGLGAFIQTKLESIIIPDTVKTIESQAFAEIDSLTSVKLGAGVTELGDQAFHHSTQSLLRSIEVDPANPAYSSVDGVLFNHDKTTLLRYPSGHPRESYTIPSGVTLVYDHAFQVAANLIEIQFPDTLTAIGSHAFSTATSLRSLSVPASVKKIGRSAFVQAVRLETLDLGEGVQEVGDYAFAYNENLKSIRLGNVRRLGAYAFQYNSSLVEFTFPDSVESVGQSVLGNNQRLSVVHIGAGLTEMDGSPFASSQFIKEIHVSAANPAYVSENGVLFNKAKTNLIQYPVAKPDTAYTIPATVEHVSDYAFQSAKFLEKVVFQEGLKSIGVSAFNNVNRLSVIELPDSLEKIGMFALSGTAVEEIRLGNHVKEISTWAFAFSEHLKSATIQGDNATLGSFAFTGATQLKSVIIGHGIREIEFAAFEPGTIIHGWDKSAAQEYAADNGLTFEIYPAYTVKLEAAAGSVVRASAQGGAGEKLYRFRVGKTGADQTVVKQAYSSRNEYQWGGLEAGSYTLYVDAKDENGVILTAATTVTVGGSSSSGYVPADSSTPAVRITDNTGKELQTIRNVEVKADRVELALTADMLDTLFHKAATDSTGIQRVGITIPQIGKERTYMLNIPSSYVAAGNGKKRLGLTTALGTVEISDQLLTVEQIGQTQNLTLRMSAADTSKLDARLQAQIGKHPVIELSIVADGRPVSWNNDAAPASIAIPYTPSAAEQAKPEQLGIVHIDDQGQAILLSSASYDQSVGAIRFTTPHFSTFAVVFIDKPFGDMNSYAWADSQVATLVAKGIIKGTAENTFSPGANVTRADFVTMLVRTLGLRAEASGQFEDVAEGSYYAEAVAVARELGIAQGAGNRFYPTNSITRQDMMVLTERALRKVGKLQSTVQTQELEGFTDRNQIAGYAEESIAALVEKGLIQGTNNRIRPEAMTTRAEAAVFLYRVYSMKS